MGATRCFCILVLVAVVIFIRSGSSFVRFQLQSTEAVAEIKGGATKALERAGTNKRASGTSRAAIVDKDEPSYFCHYSHPPDLLKSELMHQSMKRKAGFSPPFWQGDKAVCSLDNNKAVPMVLMSRGRSGSGSTWTVITKLTGLWSQGDEYVGESVRAITKFFDAIPPGDNGNWLLDVMCEKQNKYPSAGVVGFKWKPRHNITVPSSIDALKLIAHSSLPQIKVVRSQRNALDVTISEHKHRRAPNRLRAHCKENQTNCLRQHKEFGTGIILPTHNLVDKLRSEKCQEAFVDSVLEELGVPHVSVTYEKLYNSNDAEEWMRIFRFLGVGPTLGLTMAEVNNATSFIPTHNRWHNETLGNYKEVKAVLEGTEFEMLLN